MALTVLDGGMGGELIRRHTGSRGELWSAQALLDAPESVAEVHRDYIDAGARVIITNTYSTIPSYLGKAGLEDRYLELANLAGEIARRVADDAEAEVTVAGSIPPLGESYRFDLVPPDDEAREVYEPLVRTLVPYVDLFLCETMSCVREAVNAAAAVRAVSDKPLWISWTLHETAGKGLRSQETIEAAVQAVEPFTPAALLFNCTSPEAISAGLAELRELTEVPMGAYPNRLIIPEGWTLDNDVATGYREMSVEEFQEHARHWQALGATMIGGCCGLGPEFIRAIA